MKGERFSRFSTLPTFKVLTRLILFAETPVPIQFTPFLGILAGVVVTLSGTEFCHF